MIFQCLYMKPPVSILVVGDDKKTEALRVGLRDTDLKIKTAFSESGNEALSLIEKDHYDLIISLYGTRDMDGPRLIEAIVVKKGDIPLAVIVNQGNEESILNDLAGGLDFDLIAAGMLFEKEYLAGRISDILHNGSLYRGEEETRSGRSGMFMKGVLESTDYIGIIATDVKGTITLFNKGAERILGYSREEVVGKMNVLDFHIDEEISGRQKELSEKYGRHLDEIEVFFEVPEEIGFERREWSFRRKDGELITVELTVTRMTDRSGEPSGSLGIFNDITEEKELREELKRYKIQYSGIIAHIPDPTFAIDLEGRVIAWNYAIEDLTGIKASQMLGKGDYEYSLPFYGKRRPMLADLVTVPKGELETKWEYETIIKTGKVISAEALPFKFKGKNHFIRASASPIYDTSGSVIGAIESFLDITAIINTEEALAREKANVEYIIDSLPGMFYMFYMFDKNGRFIRWNKNMETLTGYSEDEISKMKPIEFVEKSYEGTVSKAIKTAFSKGYSDLEATIVTKDGEKIPFFFSANMKQIDGVPYILGMGLDITKSKDKDAEIRKLASVVRHSGEMISLTDPEGDIHFINEAGVGMIGIGTDKIIRHNFMDLLPEDEKEKMRSEVLPLIMEKGSWEGDLRYVNLKTGNPVDVHAMIFTISDPETEEPVHIANISLNITDRKKAEATLKEVNKKLNLLGSITRHDILNQITVAQGYMEIIDMDGLVEKGTKLSEYCGKVADAVETIKKQILFTKDYKDMGEQSPEWYNIGRIIEDNYRSSGYRSVKLVNETGDLEIFADPLFGKVIYNLFDNAVKHGEKITTIKFYFRRSGEDLDLICEDDGIGVPDEVKEKIFRREYYKNTGLGLFLSREILSITGLTIEETGRYGEGARFVIHIPKGLFRFREQD